MSTLAAGLRWLDQHVNHEAAAGGPPRAGSTGGLSLDRMRALVHVLGDPQTNYPVIHLTGTNGKGSTARLATGLLAESGLTVGTYTSPHLERINERIARNGEPIDDDDLAALLADLERLVPLAGVAPSYFELLTAAALRWFADVAVDVAVIEVGLLGRYDATNVGDGEVAVVTNIGHDHTDFVGDWRARIAEEKAGIIKPGSTLVLGETDPAVQPIFDRAGAARNWYRDVDFGCESNLTAVGGRLLDLRTPAARYEEVYLPLHGEHQGENAVLALAAAEAFFDAPLTEDVVSAAFGAATSPGRFEVVRTNPLVVLDGAHNPRAPPARSPRSTRTSPSAASASSSWACWCRAIPSSCSMHSRPTGRRSWSPVPRPSPRAVPADDVGAAAKRLGANVIVEPDVARAVDRALAQAGEDDAVLVTGSLYVVGAAPRAHLVG